jgi:hypothetical protein
MNVKITDLLSICGRFAADGVNDEQHYIIYATKGRYIPWYEPWRVVDGELVDLLWMLGQPKCGRCGGWKERGRMARRSETIGHPKGNGEFLTPVEDARARF